jgi:hypothetical protein
MRERPQISANDLALFMVSSDTARVSIVRRSKHPKKPPIIRYRDARAPIRSFLSDQNRRVNPLLAAEEALNQRATDPSESALSQDDARQTIEVLHAIQGMGNRLAAYDFHLAPTKQEKLALAGVIVSVYADLLVYGATRGRDQFGAAVFRLTQDDAATETAQAKRREMGVTVATLARRHAEENLQSNRELSNRLCMSIDVQHGDIFVAPDSITRRMNDLENACRFIAALWATV